MIAVCGASRDIPSVCREEQKLCRTWIEWTTL